MFVIVRWLIELVRGLIMKRFELEIKVGASSLAKFRLKHFLLTSVAADFLKVDGELPDSGEFFTAYNADVVEWLREGGEFAGWVADFVAHFVDVEDVYYIITW